MSLREIRESYNVTQSTVANLINIPLRTYVRYENDESYGDKLKRQKMIELLESAFEITEDKGILTIDQIKKAVLKVVESNYKDDIEFVFLFGSYAKGYAGNSSDVDLCISTKLSGFKFLGLAESLRIELSKRVDVIRLSDLSNNIDLVTEIMKDGIKIYG